MYEYCEKPTYKWVLIINLTLFRMSFFGAAHELGGGGVAKSPSPYLKSVIDILQWWSLAQLYLTLKGCKKYANLVTHLLSSADISNFSPEISRFCYIKKYMYRLHFDTLFLILLTFLESLKISLIKKVTILMVSAKWLPQAFLKKGLEIKVMTSWFMSMTSPTKFYHVIQVIL